MRTKRVAHNSIWHLIGLYLLSLLVLLLIGLCAAYAIFTLDVLRQLDQEGLKTEATITSHVIRKSSKGVKKYSIIYRYNAVVGGSEIQIYTEKNIKEEIYNRLLDGSQIPISYLPSHPNTNRLIGIEEDNFELVGTLVVMGVLGLFWAFLIVKLFKKHMDRRREKWLVGLRSTQE